MTIDAGILRSLRSDPDMSIDIEDGVRIDDDASYGAEIAMDDENHERFLSTCRGIGEARNIARGLNPAGWSQEGLDSVRARMSDWEYDCWSREQDTTPTLRRLEMDRLIAEGTEAQIAAFRERNAIADALEAKAGSPR